MKPMSGSFFDTNCLLYLGTADARKADRIAELLDFKGAISVQVLNEIVNVSKKKLKLPVGNLRTLLNAIRAKLDVHSVTIDTHELGLRLGDRYGFAVYDSFIVAAALLADCDTLWSEDMQDGLMVHGRMKIRNPFSIR